MKLLNGKLVANEILDNLGKKIAKEKAEITLAIIIVGDNEASKIYIKNKVFACNKIGIKTKVFELKDNVSEKELIKLIEKLNNDKMITGIILQSPIPKELNFNKIANLINKDKDVDGFNESNLYLSYHKEDGFVPCTAKGIIYLLKYYNIPLKGKNVVIIGRGNLVGKPLSLLMLNEDATVTICHSKTINLKKITRRADIIVSATGKVNLITKDMVKWGAIIVDVGITRYYGKLHGDVDFDKVKHKCKYLSPVPGGVGPMTIAMLLENVYEAYQKNK